MKLKGPYQPSRNNAVGKTVYVRIWRGQAIVSKWPRKRTKITHPTTLAQMEKFRQANWMAKYTAARVQTTHRQIVEGTQLLPRDLMIAAMYGRGFFSLIPNQPVRYPVAAIRDLSDTLDILGTKPSDVIARGPDRWQGVSATQAGQALVSGQPGEAPAWQTLSGGTGLWQQIDDVTLAAPLALNVPRNVIIPATAQEIEFTLYVPNTPLGVQIGINVNSDLGANYVWGHSGVRTGNGTVSQLTTGAVRWILLHTAIAPAIGRLYATGRVFQPAGNDRIGLLAQVISGSQNSQTVNGIWLPAAPTKLSLVGFASVLGEGLPAGTRIIVRAAIP